jgi:hypothetical protein
MTLSNDEVSTDDELVSYFMEEGGLTQNEASGWVAKRSVYLNNIVISPGISENAEKREAGIIKARWKEVSMHAEKKQHEATR